MKKLGRENIKNNFDKSPYSNDFELLEPISDSITGEFEIYHKACKQKFQIKNLDAILSGYRNLKCPYCSNTKIFSEKTINNILKNDGYNVKFLYKNDFNHALITHEKCGESFHIDNFRTWQKNKLCPICGSYVSFFNLEIANKIVGLKSKDFKIIECTTFEGSFKCQHKCGYIFSQKSFKAWVKKNELICPICSGNSKSLNLEVIKEKMIRKFGNTFSIIDAKDDIKSKDKFLVKSNICKHEAFLTSWDYLKQRDTLCKYCGNKKGYRYERLEIDYLKEKMLEDPEFFNNYEILNLEEYENINKANLKIFCKKCNKVYLKSASNFIFQKHVCKCTQHSRAEDNVKEFLDTNKIYNIQHNYGLIDANKKLEIDFQFLFNDRLYWLELNGEFHYPGTVKFKDDNGKILLASKRMFKNDNLKVQYAKDNKKNFIVIPFWEFKNIKNILDSILNDKNIDTFDITFIQSGKARKELNLERFNF